MKFILFVEGYTENKVIAAFLKSWLDPRLTRRVGIDTVRFDGWADLRDNVRKKTLSYLNSPRAEQVIAVISLIDLYGPIFYPPDTETTPKR